MYTELFVFALAQERQQQAHLRAGARRAARQTDGRPRRSWWSRRLTGAPRIAPRTVAETS